MHQKLWSGKRLDTRERDMGKGGWSGKGYCRRVGFEEDPDW